MGFRGGDENIVLILKYMNILQTEWQRKKERRKEIYIERGRLSEKDCETEGEREGVRFRQSDG